MIDFKTIGQIMLNTCNSFNQKQNNNLSKKKHVFLEIELFIQIHVSFHHYKKNQMRSVSIPNPK